MLDRNRSFVEKLIAQWPGVLGLLSAAVGIFIIWQVHQGGRHSGSRAGLVFIVIGLVLVGYWAMANRDDGYNF